MYVLRHRPGPASAGGPSVFDDPRMAGFVERLAGINARADGAPGFVWRLQSADGDATAIRAFPDDLLIVNLSV